MRNSFLLSVLALVVMAPATLVACSHEEDRGSTTESNATAAEGDDKDKPAEGADEGSVCWSTSECQEGLVCKKRPSGPPPGGMPA